MGKRKSIWNMDIDEIWGFAEHVQFAPMAYSADAQLPYPHYTNDYWNTARLIYGREQKCTEVNYSDRLWQWDSEAAERAGKAVKGMPDTAARAEKWLSAYHGKPVQLRYIMGGCNAATGYAYYVYGYDYVSLPTE
jgi:hypothetical protein